MPAPEELVESVRQRCARGGFDLIQPLQIGWYNREVEGSLRLEDFGAEQNLAILVGNTRALWPVFLDELERDPALAGEAEPLDAYTTRVIGRAAAELGVEAQVRFAHEAGGRRVAMQRLAHAAGLAFSTETHQSVHPTYGPWIALRAVISAAAAGPAGPPPRLAHPCGGCGEACRRAFADACATLGGAAPSERNLVASWRAWLGCRQACPTGAEHCYSERQAAYHYTRDRELLRRGR